MTINLNVNPYYDDFDENKNYLKILFKPGYAVQARELTQIQTILQKQIERFGNHVFQHGSMVIPGNSQAELGVQYAKLEQAPGYTFRDSMFAEGNIIVGETNGVKAIVKYFANADDSNPRTVYFSYISGGVIGGVANGVNEFVEGEELYLESDDTIRVRAQTGEGSLGFGSIAQINEGVFYINGYFVKVLKQTAVISRYTSTPTCRVVLRIIESITTSQGDSTLLDPSQGTFNYAAPGADRYGIDLVFERRDYNDPLTDDVIEIMRYNGGELEEHTRFPKYSELEKSLAKRTFEESGNYRVSGLNIRVNEHKKFTAADGRQPNEGLYSDGDIGKFVLSITPGKAYINGFGIDKIGATRFVLDKARGLEHTKTIPVASMRPEVGQYLYAADITGAPVTYGSSPTIRLYTDATRTVQIGTAKVYTIDSVAGSDPSRVYAIGFYDLALTSPFTLIDAGAFDIDSTSPLTQGRICHKFTITNPAADFGSGEIVAFTPSAGAGRRGTVEYFERSSLSLYVYRHTNTNNLPVVGDFIEGLVSGAQASVTRVTSTVSNANSTLIVELPYDNVKSVKGEAGVVSNEYYVWKHYLLSTTAGGTGSVSTTSTNEAVVAIEDGTFLAYGPSGLIPNGQFSLSSSGTTINLLSGGPANGTVVISCIARVINGTIRTKTLSSLQTQSFTGSLVTGTNYTAVLANTDIHKISKVTLTITVNGNPTVTDITQVCILDNGQRDHAYENGRITYRGTLPPVTGNSTNTITVEYTYFSHSAGGDFFAIDSYANQFVGSTEYESVKPYVSTTGQVYDLRKCLDFRKSGTSSGTPVSGYLLNTAVQYFVGYNVVPYLNTRDVEIIVGPASDTPPLPSTPKGTLRIGKIYVPPYTDSVKNITFTEDRNYRYTMADIAKIDSRVSTLEYFSTLSMKEKGLVDFSVTDASTGLDRFKSGLIVEEFANQLVSSDAVNPGTSISYLMNGITAGMSASQNSVVMLGAGSNGSTNFKVADSNKVLIDYEEVEWTTQPLSSGVENLNPYLVFSWKGTLKLTPSFDSFVETVNLPQVVNNSELTETITVNRESTTIIEASGAPLRTLTTPAASLSRAPVVVRPTRTTAPASATTAAPITSNIPLTPNRPQATNPVIVPTAGAQTRVGTQAADVLLDLVRQTEEASAATLPLTINGPQPTPVVTTGPGNGIVASVPTIRWTANGRNITDDIIGGRVLPS